MERQSSLIDLPKKIPFNFLEDITDDFSEDRKIAEDPFGALYKGILEDRNVIAVKKLQENGPLPAEKTFQKEVQNIMVLKHENLVALLGYCHDAQSKMEMSNGRYTVKETTESLLCYEYLPNGSLQDYLFGKTKAAGDSSSSSAEPSIDWHKRFNMIKGICHGLHFLHNLSRPIIHMDLKHENIWLDENMVPKIGNFGLSRLFGEEQSRMRTQSVMGSYGYMAPEYLYSGEISAQSDIYSLGLMIIEITTGEKNSPEDNQPSARRYIDKIRRDWTDDHIAPQYKLLHSEGLKQVHACIKLGLQCVEIDRRNRPSIEKIVDTLDAS